MTRWKRPGDHAAAMKALRVFKTEMALLIALCDLAGVWPVMRVTEALTETADAALQGTVRYLFRQAVSSGKWLAADAGAPDIGSGYIVLGMGKYGAHELNYSSDIDLDRVLRAGAGAAEGGSGSASLLRRHDARSGAPDG